MTRDSDHGQPPFGQSARFCISQREGYQNTQLRLQLQCNIEPLSYVFIIQVIMALHTSIAFINDRTNRMPTIPRLDGRSCLTAHDR